jgi:hypothetical protein
MFNNLLYEAVDLVSPSLLAKVMPYDLGEMVPFEPRLLADWAALLYQRDVESAAGDARKDLLRRACDRLDVSESGGRRAPEDRTTRRSLQVTSMTYQLILLPVWCVVSRTEGRWRTALVNGQTGTVGYGGWRQCDLGDSAEEHVWRP